jgi:hypothetical protein
LPAPINAIFFLAIAPSPYFYQMTISAGTSTHIYILAMIASPNPEQLTSFAPGMSRSKS